MKFESINQILDFAIEKEENAAQFYTDLAAGMDKPHIKRVFVDFALEEKSHKAKLALVKAGQLELSKPEAIMNLKLAEMVSDVDLGGDFDYQKALIAAMKNEKASYKLYTDLAEMTDDEKVKNIFLSLAQEEAKHKLRFEIEYDETILTEN
ncbi:MAG TPA: rubrerythrin [Bacteroidetes bacterium]|nr:rubrerythrin [Bacteroidota bacterium]